MGIVTATNDRGRLYLGFGDENSVSRCLGSSIETFRNAGAKFFATLFGAALEIQVDGKNRCVSKKGFKQHLQSIGFDATVIDEVSRIGYDTFIRNNQDKLLLSSNILGETFSIKKRMRLFEKMVCHLEVNNSQAVKRLIRKGAYIDREFFKPCGGALSDQTFWNSRSEIESYLHYKYLNTNFCSYTPLTMAAEKGNQSLAKFILSIKNGDFSSDKKVTYKYYVTDGGNGTHWKTKVIKTEQTTMNKDAITIV